MKKMTRFLSFVMVLCMVMTMLPTTVLAAQGERVEVAPNTNTNTITGQDVSGSNEDVEAEGSLIDYINGYHEALEANDAEANTNLQVEQVENPGLDLKLNASEEVEAIEQETYAANEMVRVIVVLEEGGLLDQGFSAKEISASTAATQSAVTTMTNTQNAVMAKIENVTAGYEVTMKYRYSVAINGLAVEVPYGSLEDIKAIEGVETAFVAPCYDVPEDTTSADTELSPLTSSSTGMVGAVNTWESLGYTGAGMTVAIIDTGLDLDHPSFAADPELTEDSMTLSDVAKVLPFLNAASYYGSGLKATDLYRSAKVPFAFNYVDASLDATHDNDSQGDHGTHVAGIVAANKLDTTDVVGVAPDAQLVIMKVFGASGGAYFDDILAALEDCYRLDVDVVNMSLGSPAGFSSEDAYADGIYAKILESDMIVAIAAGNEGDTGDYETKYGYGMETTSNPDTGLVGSPGTLVGGTTVASAENNVLKINYFTVGDTKIPYNDVNNAYGYSTGIAGTFGGQTLEYVMVPGTGAPEDYEGLDVTGKVAVVQRGTLAFTEKQTNAADAGAIACLVYDNVDDGEFIYMQDAGVIPNGFITKAAGELLAASVVDGVGQIWIAELTDMTDTVSPSAGTMSTFSSWGVTPSLQLEPDITAPGGNIYSCYTDGQYGLMSGTSMASPAVAGMSALLLQHLHDTYDNLSDADMHTIAEALLMSTASPMVDPSNPSVHYSPRLQGAGMANIYDAITSGAYLTVNHGTPKASLGDDDDKTGVYTFNFEVNNLSDETKVYHPTGYAMTDWVTSDGAEYFMSQIGVTLDATVEFSANGEALPNGYDLDADGDVDLDDVQLLLDMVNGVAEVSEAAQEYCDLNGDEILDTADAQIFYEMVVNDQAQMDLVYVAPGQSVELTVTITLSDDDKAYMDTYYPNGIYVEGFISLVAGDGATVDLGLPYLAFYGDWSDADMFDDTWYFEDGNPSRYYHVLWTVFGGDDLGYILGMNPYLDEEYDPYHNVLSPNGDGYQDYIGEIYLGMMRSARGITFTWDILDEEGNVKKSATQLAEYTRKSYYYSYYGVNLPFMYTDYFGNTADLFSGLKNNTQMQLTVEGYLDDGDFEVDDRLTMTAGGEEYDTIPIYIDTEKPVIVDDNIIYNHNPETDERTITFQVSDNHAIAAVATTTLSGDVIEMLAVEDSDEPTEITLDVTGYDANFYIAVCDYGANENYYYITFPGNDSVDFDRFYAYSRYGAISYSGYIYLTDYYNGWYSFETPSTMLQHTSQYTMGETAVAAAEYVDGYILGVDVSGNIFAMKAGTWTRSVIGKLELPGAYSWSDPIAYSALDMAFDYTTNTLYILTDELSAGAGGHLVTMDYLTGAITDLGIVKTSDGSQPLTLACDNGGVLYTIDYVTGDLYTIDTEDTVVEGDGSYYSPYVTYIVAERVGSTGYVPYYAQSMTVDHETNKLYWAAYSGATSTNYLAEVNKTTGELTIVDYAAHNDELVALIKPYKSAVSLYPTDAALTGISISDSELAMAVGNQYQLVCSPVPYYAELGEVTWTSSNSRVVSVDANGLITAKRDGDAVITATCGDLTVTCTVAVVSATADMVVFDAGVNNEWLSFNLSDSANATSMTDATIATGTYDYFMAAARVGDVVYAFDTAGGFYKLDAATMQGARVGTNDKVNGSSGIMMALSFNYDDGYLYGVAMTGSYFESYYNLVRVNPANGEMVTLAEFDTNTYGTPMNLAIDPDGNFYYITTTYDPDTYETVDAVVTFQVENEELTGFEMTTLKNWASTYNGYGSLVYSASNEALLWADPNGNLDWINPESGTIVTLGTIGTTADSYPMNMGLIEMAEEDPKINYADPETVTMPASFLVMVGGSVNSDLTVEPWNSVATVTYTMADTAIAEIDDDGKITGLAAGETTLTAYVEELDLTLTATVKVVESTGELYGNVISDFMYGGNFWVKIPDTDPTAASNIASGDDSFAIYSGAYYNGKIYAYGQDQYGDYEYKNYFLIVNADDYSIEVKNQVSYTLRDMAFDYTTGVLYAIAEGGEYVGTLVQVDTATGTLAAIGDCGKILAALTVDADGKLYAIGNDTNLYAIDKTTGAATLIGSTGVSAVSLYQSMHYDMDTGNTYWARVASDYSNGLYLVDLETGSATNLGTVGTGAEVGALYTVPTKTPEVPATLEPTAVKMNEKNIVTVGKTVTLTATVLPLSVATVDNTLTWTSSNEAVATVSGGVVTGVAAGEAVITATTSNGISATCTVTVTAADRKFYAYDETNTQWISFSGEDTTNVTVVRDDAEGEAALLAATYADGTLYAYDVNGYFYTLDANTFARSEAMVGVSATTVSIETYDWWGDVYVMELPVQIIDLSYDNGKLYAAAAAVDYGWSYGTIFAEVNVTTGELKVIYQTAEVQPGNLLVLNGKAFYIDTFMSGLLTVTDLTADSFNYVQQSLVYNYWGDFNTSSSFIKDAYTGTIYVLRDNQGGSASLNTFSLGDADIDLMGTIGTGIEACGLFLK